MPNTKEHQRLAEISGDIFGWRRWGPYVSDRAWATVREDYSLDGNAWDYFPHDLARSKAYRWGEDGIAGLCDRYQLIVFAPAFWNGRDVILKERLFGLTCNEGNHGEDAKEYYFHLDNTPTHSYMRFLYKYPQAEYPYGELLTENRRRGGQGFEYELIDTGVFDGDRYFDIFIEYAKDSPEDLVMRIEAFNRGPVAAPLDILPHLWFRNTWAWGAEPRREPIISMGPDGKGHICLIADDTAADPVPKMPMKYAIDKRYLYAPAGGEPLFTNNETNMVCVYGEGNANRKPYVKDAFHRHVVNGEPNCVNPARVGTRAAIRYHFDAVPPGGSVKLEFMLADHEVKDPLKKVAGIIRERRAEADEFYAAVQPSKATDDERLVQRQALAGLLWTKQSYFYDVGVWFDGDNPKWPPAQSRRKIRNNHWQHLNSMRVMTVPDKWEYPWFAAWDLAFHCIPFTLIDPGYAKDQLWLLLFEQFQHPNGQIPAYEWEFSDLNPPVHAWAVWRVYNMEKRRTGKGDREFLEKCFHKLLINFAWWINKVDSSGNNVFEGGFLGLDNITVVDRSEKLPAGARLEQSDATGWMGMFCLNLMRIALELAVEDRAYQGLATKFFQHYVYVAAAMKHMGSRDYQLWDEEDGFFYDVLTYPDGRFKKFRVRSLVGLIPLFAVERLDEEWMQQFDEFTKSFNWFITNKKNLTGEVVHRVERDGEVTHVLTIVNENQLNALMNRMWDSSEFLSDYGIRSLSKTHLERPFEFEGRTVGYEVAEAVSKIKGGNSNWRGPLWFPTTFLLIESLRKLGSAYGQTYTLEPPAFRGNPRTFSQLANEIADRMIRIFTRDAATGRRPVYGGTRKFQEDPHWRDNVLFYEYFHGDNGAGLGASHQTGWTALVASLIDEWRK